MATKNVSESQAELIEVEVQKEGYYSPALLCTGCTLP